MKIKILIVCAILFTISCAVFRSPLMNAASNGDIETAQKLMKNGADLNARDHSGLTPLMMAIKSGKPTVAKTFIQMGADIKIQDKQGYTALTYAIENEQKDIVHLLIDMGADIGRREVVGYIGYTPLMHAVLYDQLEIAKYLIEKHANMDDRDVYGNTPLLIAATNGYASMVKLLIDHGADINAKNKSNLTALHHATKCDDREGGYNVAKILIENGADISVKDKDEQTPLKYAFTHQMTDIVILIRNKYPDYDDTSLFSNYDAQKVPLRVYPEQGTYLIPQGKDKAYTNAISDCNNLTIPRQGMAKVWADYRDIPGYIGKTTTTIEQVKFQTCMEKMGFKCIKNCSK